MPKNRLIYVGVLVVAAVAIIYVAHWITDHVQWILPWMLGVGIALIVGGVVWEARRSKEAAKELAQGLRPGTTQAENIKETAV